MTEAPNFHAYQIALQAHQDELVGFEMPLLHLTMLVSALQLAARHPRFPAGVRPFVEGFIASAIARLDRADPVLGDTFRAGNDPAQDVEDARWRAEEPP
jgi:hypothetical protein